MRRRCSSSGWITRFCAIGKAEIALIPREDILRLFEKRPSVGFAIWRETLLDAAIFREAITNNGSRPVLARMAHLFCELHYRARAAGLAKPGSCRLPIHQGQIGETLGISIVTVNARSRRCARPIRWNSATRADRSRLEEADRGERFRPGLPAPEAAVAAVGGGKLRGHSSPRVNSAIALLSSCI